MIAIMTHRMLSLLEAITSSAACVITIYKLIFDDIGAEELFIIINLL